MQKLVLALIAILTLGVAPLHAADYQKGLDAYNSGDFATALKEWQPLAEQGVAEAQNNLGEMYGHGLGVPQDYNEAVKWYRLAAEQGVIQAQNNLGAMYYNGQGVPQDYIIAYMWFNLATANGHENASKKRNEIAKTLTQADISKAQDMSRACLASNYKSCGN